MITRKIIACILAFAMVLSMCAFTVSADAAEVLITQHNFESFDAGKTVASGSNFGAGTSSPTAKIPSNLYLRGTSNKLNAVVEEAEDGNKYISVTHNRIGFNHNKKAADFATHGSENYPVFEISFDIMIPDDDEYKTNTRDISIAAGSSGSSVISTSIVITDGVVKAYCSRSNAVIAGETDFEYGKWTHFTYYGWVNENNKFVSTVFMEDTLLAYTTSSSNSTGHMTSQINFDYFNSKDNSGRIDNNTDANRISSVTCYDNFNMKLLPASYMFTDVSKIVDRVIITRMDADSLLAPSSADAGEYADADGVRTVYGGKGGTYIIPSEGIFDNESQSFVQSSNTTKDTDYTIVTEADGKTALKMSSTGKVHLVQNTFARIPAVVSTPGKYTFNMSAEMKIPKGTEAGERRIVFHLGLDSSGSTSELKKAGISFNAYVKDGKVYFNSERVEDYCTDVNGAKKREKRDIPLDEWFKVDIVVDTVRDAEGFKFKVYGIYDNEVIYVNEHTMPFADRDGNGKDDEFSFVQSTFVADVAAGNTAVVDTYLDSYSVVRNDKFDWSGIDTNAWVDPVTNFNTDADGNLLVSVVSGRDAKFTEGTLVIAICNEKGIVKEVITSKAITDGEKKNSFNYKVPAGKVAGSKMIKTFVFDSLATAKPLTPNSKYIVE